jgi:thiamine-monophosphate kinase
MNKLDPVELTLYGGEEYELVLTIKPSSWRKAREAVKKAGGELLAIGRVTQEKQILLEADGEKQVIEARGYEHFVSGT